MIFKKCTCPHDTDLQITKSDFKKNTQNFKNSQYHIIYQLPALLKMHKISQRGIFYQKLTYESCTVTKIMQIYPSP